MPCVTETWTHCELATQKPPGQPIHPGPPKAGQAGTRTCVALAAGDPQPMVGPPGWSSTIVRVIATPALTQSQVFANSRAAGALSPDGNT